MNNDLPYSDPVHPLSAAERIFIDKLGLSAEQGGLTRVTGRIWGLLVVVGDPMPPATIAATLEISRGGVSGGLKTLEQFDLLEQSTKPGDRQTYFAMRAHPYSAMILALKKQTFTQAAMVRNAQAEIGTTSTNDRLEDLASFYEIMEEGYQVMLDRMAALSAP